MSYNTEVVIRIEPMAYACFISEEEDQPTMPNTIIKPNKIESPWFPVLKETFHVITIQGESYWAIRKDVLEAIDSLIDEQTPWELKIADDYVNSGWGWQGHIPKTLRNISGASEYDYQWPMSPPTQNVIDLTRKIFDLILAESCKPTELELELEPKQTITIL